MMMGDNLESTRICSTNVLPKRSVMFNQSCGCVSIMAHQRRQMCAMPGTQHKVVFLTGLLEGARTDSICKGSPCSVESEQRNRNVGTHYSPGVDRAASFDVEMVDGPGQNRKKNQNSEDSEGEGFTGQCRSGDKGGIAEADDGPAQNRKKLERPKKGRGSPGNVEMEMGRC